MKNILLTVTFFLSLFASGQSVCTDAIFINPTANCEMGNFNFESNSNTIWLKFNVNYSNVDLVLTNTYQNNQFQLSSLELFTGSCSNLIRLDSLELNNSLDTISLDSLIINQDYFLKVERNNSTSNVLSCCITPKGIGSYWHNNFSNSSGNSLLYCQTLLPIDWEFEPLGNQNCNEITVCINDVLNLEIVPAIYLGNTPSSVPVPHQFVFEIQNGASFSTDVNSLNTNLSFSSTGIVTFRLYPIALANLTNILLNEPEFVFTVHVVDEEPEAVWDNNSICQSGVATLSSLSGATFSSVTVDGVSFVSGSTQISFNSQNFSSGTHVVNYTLNGLCGPTNFTTSFTIIEQNGLELTVDNCGNATFVYTNCGVQNTFNATLDFGDGYSQTVQVVNGQAVFLHHYTNFTPLTYFLSVSYYNGISYYNESGVVSALVPQNIIISSSEYVCELTTISMSPTNLTNIAWSTNPVLSFTGQTTPTITPNSTWNSYQADIMVSVLALDQNGCLFAGQKLIESCCAPKNGILPNTEFFEKNYYSHTSILGLNSSIPSGVNYYGPTNVVINLPSPPTIYLNTSYSIPVTLSSLVSAGLVTMVGGVLNIPQGIYLNNDLIIDINVVLAPNNFVRIAPGRNIIINSGVNFSSTNSTFAPKCKEMWGGFIVNGTGSSIKLDKCNVVGAVSGILSQNGGTISATSCVFVDNLNGIVITDNSVANTYRITDCYFGDISNQALLPPYSSELIPRTGIYIKNVSQLIIGSDQTFAASNPATKGNLFHNLKIGIDGVKSNFSVYRNSFYKMTPEETQPALNYGDEFCGVRSSNTSFVPITLNVGSSNTNLNLFHSCDFGISAKNRVNLNAKSNYMRNVRLRGISWDDNRGLTAKIDNNQINSTNPNAWGIYVKNYPYGSALIENNKINTNVTGIPLISSLAARLACGIYASTVTPNIPQTTKISFNTVNNSLYGIWCLNISNATIANNNVNLNFSTANVNQLVANYAPLRGIIVQYGSTNQIISNTILWSFGVGNNVTNDKLQGIRIEAAPASRVWTNIMTNTAVGFYARGSNMGSKVECNVMNNTNNGFYMDFADISTQGLPVNSPTAPNGYSAHNLWNNTLSARTDGKTINHATNFLYYYHASNTQFNSNPTIAIAFQPNNWKDIVLFGSGNGAPRNSCAQSIQSLIGLPVEQIEKRNFEMLQVVKDSMFYDTLSSVVSHFLHQDVFNRLRLDTALLHLNSVDDIVYQNYKDSMFNTNYYSIIQSQEAIANKDFVNSSALIAQLDESNSYIDLIKKVETIWNSSQTSEISISSLDSAYLFEIACLDPLKEGAGVYIARSILDYDGWCFDEQSQLKSSSIQENESSLEPVAIWIAPNPSDGKLEITSKDLMQKIQLVDLSGKIIETIHVNSYNQKVNFSVQSGMYILIIQLQNGTFKTTKIEIQ